MARLDRLVTDISNASRLDAELVRERMQKFDLGQLVTTLATMTEMRAAERDVRVATRLPNDPLLARGPARRDRHPAAPPCSTSQDSRAFCACSRFSASCQTSEADPSMTSAVTSWPR